MPGYVEWALAFPRAPRGSVSVQIWGIACATVVQLVGQAAVGVWVLGVGYKEKVGKQADVKQKSEPIAMSGTGEGGKGWAGGEKKDL